jgi:hypothetical protein
MIDPPDSVLAIGGGGIDPGQSDARQRPQVEAAFRSASITILRRQLRYPLDLAADFA